jgi:hypothetical protein
MPVPLLVRALGIGKKIWDGYTASHKAKVLSIARKQATGIQKARKTFRNKDNIDRSVRRQIATTNAGLLGIQQAAKQKEKKKKKKKKHK